MGRKLCYMMLLGVMLILTACSAKSSSSIAAIEDTANQSEAKESLGFSKSESVEDIETEEAKADTTEQNNVASNRKLIKRVYLSVETKEFDDFQVFLDKEIESLGGYIESSEVSGNSYLYDENSRYCNLIIRIPSHKLENFVQAVGTESNILRQTSNQEDITLEYVDTQSHNKALKIQQERLLVLLSKAEKLADIITLEERLSEVRYQIEAYESELRTYDNLVDYSTVTVEVNEVLHMTPAVSENIGQRIQMGLSENLLNIKIGFQNFFVWFVISLPYLFIWAVVLIVIGSIVMVVIRKKRQRMVLKQASVSASPIVEGEEKSEEKIDRI